MERSEEQKFRDDATQSVWFRDMPVQSFAVTEEKDYLKIETDACVLIVREKREDCRIQLGGSDLKIDNSGNLKGTSRTLDGYDGDMFVGLQNKKAKDMSEDARLQLEDGVCSLNGIAVFDDAGSLTLGV